MGWVAIPVAFVFGLSHLCHLTEERFGYSAAFVVMVAGIVLAFSVGAGLLT